LPGKIWAYNKAVQGGGYRHPLVFFLLLFSKNSVMPVQKSMVGHVYDAQGKAAFGAIVMISGSTAPATDIAGSADETGKFYLDNISLPGVYILQINYQGNLVSRTLRLTETDTSVTVRL
jgi:hypothetical protein